MKSTIQLLDPPFMEPPHRDGPDRDPGFVQNSIYIYITLYSIYHDMMIMDDTIYIYIYICKYIYIYLIWYIIIYTSYHGIIYDQKKQPLQPRARAPKVSSGVPLRPGLWHQQRGCPVGNGTLMLREKGRNRVLRRSFFLTPLKVTGEKGIYTLYTLYIII